MHPFSMLDCNWLIKKINNEYVKSRISSLTGIVYDFGSGTRPYEKDILLYADRYVPVDWSESYHGRHASIEADLNKPLPINDGVADGVVSFQVLEHLCEPQIMLDEAFRIMKPNASIILSVPWQWWIHEAPYDFFRYTPYGLKYLFEKAGFTDIQVEPQSGFFTMWLLKFNYFSSRFVRGPIVFRWGVKLVLIPIWYINQKIAPFLDKLDSNWAAESSGYYVTAKKSDSE